jgi:hypothetical protein
MFNDDYPSPKKSTYRFYYIDTYIINGQKSIPIRIKDITVYADHMGLGADVHEAKKELIRSLDFDEAHFICVNSELLNREF